jgi:hypothetical protein
LNQKITPLQGQETRFKKALKDLAAANKDAATYANWIQQRYYWGDVLTELHRILIQVEADTSAKFNNAPTGVWIERFLTAQTTIDTTGAAPSGGAAPSPTQRPGRGPVLRGADKQLLDQLAQMKAMLAQQQAMLNAQQQQQMNSALGAAGVAPAAAPSAADVAAANAPPDTNSVSTITLSFRGVNMLNSTSMASANGDIAYAVESAVKSSPLFDQLGSQLTGTIEATDTNTFTFGMTIKLKRPLKL